MSAKTKKLVIFGTSAFAEIAYEYFTHDSDFEVVGFTVDKEFKKNDRFFDLPLINFDEIKSVFPPSSYYIFIALVYNKMNRIRKEKYLEAKAKGYQFASYLSSDSFVWRNVKLGENSFIFEDNTIQPFVSIGSNTILWSGNHIGHHSKIGDHNFFSSHVVLSGFCQVGDACFFGVNSTIANNVNIGNDCLIGAHTYIYKDIVDGKIIKGNSSIEDPTTTYEKYNLDGFDSERNSG